MPFPVEAQQQKDPTQATQALLPAPKPQLFSSQGAQDAEHSGKDQFLKMLVAQLKNQDPMKPMDDKEMVQQLATFTQVEQAMETNRQLTALQGMSATQGRTSMASLIGKKITADASVLHYNHQEGQPPLELHWNASGASTKAVVTITDAHELPVKMIQVGGSGTNENSCLWDGTDGSGKQVMNGDYKVHVAVQLTNTEGQEAKPVLIGRAGGVGFDEGGAGVMVGSARVRPQEMREIESVAVANAGMPSAPAAGTANLPATPQ